METTKNTVNVLWQVSKERFPLLDFVLPNYNQSPKKKFTQCAELYLYVQVLLSSAFLAHGHFLIVVGRKRKRAIAVSYRWRQMPWGRKDSLKASSDSYLKAWGPEELQILETQASKRRGPPGTLTTGQNKLHPWKKVREECSEVYNVFAMICCPQTFRCSFSIGLEIRRRHETVLLSV